MEFCQNVKKQDTSGVSAGRMGSSPSPNETAKLEAESEKPSFREFGGDAQRSLSC
jgi:hypothetical protein